MYLKQNSKIIRFIRDNTIYIFFVVMFIVCSFASPYFLQPVNVANLIRQNASTIAIALGMLLVVLTGGIDLSIGGIVALTNVVFAMMLTYYEKSLFFACVVTILIGAVAGACSGYLVAYRKMAPFIATLAMMQITQSLSFVISNAAKIKIDNDALNSFGQGVFISLPFLQLPNQIIPLVIMGVIFYLILRYTSFGRLIYAIGSNEKAVVLSGVNSKAIKFFVYVISGICAAISSILVMARLKLATGNIGSGYEMDAIAACVIGGASLSGGKGSAMKTIVGVFVLAFIGNIMNLMGVPAYPQDIIRGLIIIVAVLFQDN